jgi:hypothetical protein
MASKSFNVYYACMIRRSHLSILKNEVGFTLIHGLMALAVIFAIGFAGWYVSNSQADKQPDGAAGNTQNESQTQNKNESKSGFTLPKDWQWYESAELGLKFAYPKRYGDVTRVTEYCCGLTEEDFPEVAAQYKSDKPEDSGIAGVSGDFFLETYKKDVNEILSRKYGPKVRQMPNDGRWVVTKTSPDDPAQYREGTIYKEVIEKRSQSGVPVSIFETGDEGNMTYQLVFTTKDRHHMLVLPVYFGKNEAGSKKAYEAFRDQVVKSITSVE